MDIPQYTFHLCAEIKAECRQYVDEHVRRTYKESDFSYVL
jgi:hypothetical protein